MFAKEVLRQKECREHTVNRLRHAAELDLARKGDWISCCDLLQVCVEQPWASYNATAFSIGDYGQIAVQCSVVMLQRSDILPTLSFECNLKM